MKHVIHETEVGKIQQYNNSSYGWYLEGKGWRNIPKQLGEILVKKYSISDVVESGMCSNCKKKRENYPDYLCGVCRSKIVPK